MAKLLVLVTTMHQENLSKYASMHLQTDAVLANQADREETVRQKVSGHAVAMITTKDRGLSKNRNLAISFAEDADILLFADDDLVFCDGYEEIVLQTFAAHPEADAIKFNLRRLDDRKYEDRPITAFHRLKRHEVSAFGVCGLAVRRRILSNAGLRFHERFGAGTANFCGEDTIFYQEMLRKGVRLYGSPGIVAEIHPAASMWFEGYTERYFRTAGMVIAECYPILCYLLIIRSAWKSVHRKKSPLGFVKLLQCYYQGARMNRLEKTHGN